MTDPARLFTLLQHGDGLFPAGAFAFSGGLEALQAAGQIGQGDLLPLLQGLFVHRWAAFDRPLVAHGLRAGGDLERLAELDHLAEAQIFAAAMREASKRAGGAVLAAHARLGRAEASAYRRAVHAGRAHGHLPVVQGAMSQALRLSESEAVTIAAYQFLAGLGAAAIRLVLAGTFAVQIALTRLAPVVADVLREPMPMPDRLASFVPVAEIAAQLHGRAAARLFAS